MGQKTITIEKDDVQAEILPQSLPVWEKNGWTAVEDGDSGEVEAVPEEPVEAVVETENEQQDPDLLTETGE